jgi:23S rRNA (cytosine1962-C5)-methyltransferase
MRRNEVAIQRAAVESVRRGHPWVWRAAVARGLDGAKAGDIVRVVAAQAGQAGGEPLGEGIVDPGSPIAIRMWTSGRARLDSAWIDGRIASAFASRSRFVDAATTAYRLLHGEGDRTPGFVVDRYATVAVLRVDGAAAAAFAPEVAARLRAPLEAIGVKTLVQRAVTRGEGISSEVLFGPPPPAIIEVAEHGVPFVVDLAKGQKTGAFLDQRENRRRVEQIVRATGAKQVLNLFSYAGGFSLRAAIGGATKVTSVDVAAAAHATAQASFRAAGIEPKGHEFVAADAFAFLADAKAKKRTWDLVISDPPSFAPSEKAVPKAIAAYRSLHRACADVVRPGGVFCASSCSSHVDLETFTATLDDATLGRDDLRLLALHGPPEDHPTLPAWPEGRYLKFAVLGG